MNSPYIFGHRGGMGNCIENTIPCFRKAVKMGIGIESDFQITRDKKLICFHDPFIKVDSNWINVKQLSLEELNEIFKDEDRMIPTARELFTTFDNIREDLRYSCDIRDKNAGFALIKLADEFKILDRIEITERKLMTLHRLRNFNKIVKLVYTLPDAIKNINMGTVDFNKLNSLNVNVINLKSWRANNENLKTIIQNKMNCYVWGVNNRNRMKKVITLKYKDQGISAIYTDYPDRLINIYKAQFSK